MNVQNEEPTGRTRHRVHSPWFGADLMVLQVEVTYTWNESGYQQTKTYWRDAKAEDITRKDSP